MTPRELKSKKLDDSIKKMVRPSSNPAKDTHPRLQQTFFVKTQCMVYGSTIETPRNEVEYMLSQY